MGGNARPAPVFRPFDKPRPHRVHRQVARRRHQVLLVHRDRAEPRLKQVAGHPEACIDRRRVAPMRLAERASERLRAVGNENEVNVVGHQTIGPDRDALFAALDRQDIAIERIVVVAKEDALAPVAALRDVMGKAGDDELGDAGHFGCSGDMAAMNLRNLNWGLSKVSPELTPELPHALLWDHPSFCAPATRF